MRSLFKKIFLLIVTLLILTPKNVFAMAEIMPLNQVKSGMSGVGYTVIDETGIIKPFNVDIVGIFNNMSVSALPLIMARASGDFIDESGGVIHGMSGSPIYVDGKLIGALAIGYPNVSPYTFFITPIEYMTKLWDLPDTKNTELIFNPKKKSDSKKVDSDKSAGEKSDDNKSADDKSADEKVVDKAFDEPSENADVDKSVDNAGDNEKSAIFFSGFDNNGLNFLKNELQPFGLNNFYAAPSDNSDKISYVKTLQPGSAFGAAFVCGDFMLGATGTVTAVDDNKIIGFGHPFTHIGNVNFFMTDSSVLGPIKGLTGSGVRVANIGKIIGRINQDREAGVSGIVGKIPFSVPITVTVKNIQLDTIDTYKAVIAYNENLMPQLGTAITYAALSKTGDSLAQSTVAIDFSIKTNALESGTFARQNMFYNDADVGQVAILELSQALGLICSNTTEESGIFHIEVNMALDRQRKTASLISAVPDKKIVNPGETVNFTVTIQPYRKPQETLIVPYTIPLVTKEGNLTLDIHGGALVPTVQTLPAGVVVPSTEPPDKVFDKNIQQLLNAGRSNQIVIEPSMSVKKSEKELKADIKLQQKAMERVLKSGKKNSAPSNQKFETSYIIDNVIQTGVKVGKLGDKS